MPVDNDFLARADAEAKLRAIKQARKKIKQFHQLNASNKRKPRKPRDNNDSIL